MQTLRVRVARVIDFGPTVAIVGKELVSNLEVVLHIDYRPLVKIQEAWKSGGLSEKIQFEADSLIMRLDLDCAEDPDGGIPLPLRAA
jgi:hypothetical protein